MDKRRNKHGLKPRKTETTKKETGLRIEKYCNCGFTVVTKYDKSVYLKKLSK